jgi:hypothetical protein
MTKVNLVESLNQLVRIYERQLVRLDVIERYSYKDPRHIDADVELRELNRKFMEIVDRVRDDYDDDVLSLLLNAAEHIFTLKVGE